MPSSQLINELVVAKLPFHAYRSLTEPEKWGVEDGGDEFNIPPGMSKSSSEDVADALNALRTMVDELQKANVAYVEANTGLLSTIESLQRENEELRKALKPFSRAITYCEQLRKHGGDDSVKAHDFVISDEFRRARQVLASTGGEHNAE